MVARLGPDPISSAATVIIEEHRVIHDGIAHSVSRKADLRRNQALCYRLRSPDPTRPHITRFCTSAHRPPLELRMFEGADATGGASVTPENHFRGRPLAKMEVWEEPVVVDQGYQFDFQLSVGEGRAGPGAAGEWVLLPDVDYLFEVRNEDGARTKFEVRLFWYEPRYNEHDLL